jgi:hypothetical protein
LSAKNNRPVSEIDRLEEEIKQLKFERLLFALALLIESTYSIIKFFSH